MLSQILKYRLKRLKRVLIKREMAHIDDFLVFAEDIRPTKDDIRTEIIAKMKHRYHFIENPGELLSEANDAICSDSASRIREMAQVKESIPIIEAERNLLKMILSQLPRKASDGVREWEVRQTTLAGKLMRIPPSRFTVFIREILTALGYTLVINEREGSVKIKW